MQMAMAASVLVEEAMPLMFGAFVALAFIVGLTTTWRS